MLLLLPGEAAGQIIEQCLLTGWSEPRAIWSQGDDGLIAWGDPSITPFEGGIAIAVELSPHRGRAPFAPEVRELLLGSGDLIAGPPDAIGPGYPIFAGSQDALHLLRGQIPSGRVEFSGQWERICHAVFADGAWRPTEVVRGPGTGMHWHRISRDVTVDMSSVMVVAVSPRADYAERSRERMYRLRQVCRLAGRAVRPAPADYSPRATSTAGRGFLTVPVDPAKVQRPFTGSTTPVRAKMDSCTLRSSNATYRTTPAHQQDHARRAGFLPGHRRPRRM